MNDLGVLCFLAFVLGMLASCAVGAWVIGAAAFKLVFGGESTSPVRCPRCGKPGLLNGRCLHCGTVPNVSVAERARDDLQATARQLHRLHAAGHLPYDQCISLLKVLETDLARLGYPLPLEVWPTAKVTGSSPFAPPIALQGTKGAEAVAEPPQVLARSQTNSRFSPQPSQQQPTDSQQQTVAEPQVLDALVIDESTAPAVERPAAEPPVVSPFAPAARQASPIVVPPQPITPSRTLADMLQGFMEESNIRWGEIIGGLLIVTCAIGLVISLGATVKIPYFPALLFLIFTFCFHLAGLYTHWYWKLAAVSRAILIIALLLVPLGFSAGVVLERSDSQPSLALLLTAVSIGLAVFGWIAYSGSKVLAGEGALRLTTAILGCCLGQVVINRGAFVGISQQSLTLISLLPVVSFLIAAIGQIWRAQAWERMSSRRIEQTFLILGIALFALLPPYALLIFKIPPRYHTFKELAPLLCLVATSVLALGLVVHRRALAKSLAALRTAGTAIALTGGALLILLWVVAWPRPDLMLNVSVLTGGLLLAVATRTRMPALHVAATSALSVGVLIAFIWAQHLVSPNPTSLQWLQATLLGRTSLLLSGLAGALGAGGVWLVWRRDRQLGLAYLGTAGVLSVLSLVIAGWSGFVPLAAPWTGDGDLAGLLFFVYAIALFVVAIVIANENILTVAMALLWVALIQLLSANDTAREILVRIHRLPERPVLVATILAGVALASLALVLSRPSWRLSGETYIAWQQTALSANLVVPLTYGAAFAITAATPFILWVLPGRFTVHAIYAGLATSVWVIACVARRWPAALAATQAMAAVAVAFAIAAVWSPDQADRLWFIRGGHLQAQLLALAGSAAVWSIVRRFAQPKSVLHDLLHPIFPACDHLLLGTAVVLLGVLSVSAALPGIAWELGLGPRLTSADIPWLDAANVSRLTFGLASVGVALVIALVERITGWKLIGLSLAGWSGCFLLAQAWQAENAVASAARWSIVLYGAVLMAAFLARGYLQRGLQTQPWLRWKEIDEPTREWFRYQSLLLGVLPMLVLTIIAVAQFASGAALHPPVDESIFKQIGHTASYAGPLLVGVAIFLGLALGQRQPAFALGGGLLFQLAANLAFILHVKDKAVGPDGSRAAELLQWNTIAAAMYALIWFALSHWLLPRDPKQGAVRLRREKFFLGHISLSCLLVLVAALWATGGIIRFPDGLAGESQYLGHWSNLIALGLLAAPLIAAAGVTRSKRTWPLAGSVLLILLITALPMVALRWEYYRGVGTWAAYHVLEVGWLLLAAVVAGTYAWQAWSGTSKSDSQKITRRGLTPQHLLGAGLCAAVAFLAVRGNYYDPAEPYLSAWSTAGVCAVLIVLGLARRSQPYAIASLVVAPLAAALPWFTPSMTWVQLLGTPAFLVAVCSCLLATIAVGGFWQFIEIRMQRKWQQTFSPRWFGPLVGHLAIGGVTLALAIASLIHLPFVGHRYYVAGLPNGVDAGLIALVVVWLVLGIVNFGSLWDRRATFAFPVLLIWSWIACALALAPLQEMPLPVFCLFALAMAGVFAVAGHVWSYGANLAAWGEKLGISDTIGGLTRIDRWLPWLTLVLGLLLCLEEFAGMWNLERREYRVAIAFAPALVGYALACLAQQKRQAAFELMALLLGGLTCVYLGWSDLEPGWELADWMTRAFRLLMVLAVTTLGYGLVLPRFIFHAESWLRASQRAGYVSSVLAITTLLCLMGQEVALFEPGVGVAGVDPLQVGAVAVLLVLFIVGLISLALAPGAHEPHEQQRRTWFVYGTQAVAGLLFAHLYLCQPGWFDGVLKPYWPFVVMAIAFSGVGLGELFWRLRLPILAEPFQRTGAFLPVLPILGLWVVNSHNDYDYTLLLFCAGLMYLILSITRKSWAAAIAATVAGNGALWALLSQKEWRIDENPQFWLIPPAVSVLVAAHINRNRLKDEYLSGIRYASLVVIYVSSTFEIFLHRAETSLWPPIILALLSLFGALAGVLLRVRAFLYLGAVFTLLALVSMVWHAARAIDQVWPWWAFGFVMGVAILGLLAFLEKNRPQVQALVARLRQWDQ